MEPPLHQTIEDFFRRFQVSVPKPVCAWDPEWPSPCETFDPFTQDDSRLIHWQPLPRAHSDDDFAGLERAIERTIHADIKTYYGAFWSNNINVISPDGRCSLLFLWSPRDRDRLIENLVGHAFACKVNKTPFSVFFACTEDPDDYYLTVNNDTGVVQLEAPAQQPIREVAPSLAEFLISLSMPEGDTVPTPG